MTLRWTATSRRFPRKFTARVGEVLVNDNQQVKAGQVLVKLDPRDLQAAVDQAKGATGPGGKRSAIGRSGCAENAVERAERNIERRRATRGRASRPDARTNALTSKPRPRTWRGRRPMSKRAKPTRNWRKRIWNATRR